MKVCNCFFLNALVYLTLGSFVLTANVSNINSMNQKTCVNEKMVQTQANQKIIHQEDIKTELLFRY